MIFGVRKIWNLRFFLLVLLAGTFACEKEAGLNSQEDTASTKVNVEFFHPFTYDFPKAGKLSEDFGIWMHKLSQTNEPDQSFENTISKWLGKQYAPPNSGLPKKTLYEPINVIWIDFVSENTYESEKNIEVFLEGSGFWAEGPINVLGITVPRHTNGYSAFFNKESPYDVDQVGETWVDTAHPAENNHGRFFEAYKVTTNKGYSAYITMASFSREGVAGANGVFCGNTDSDVPCHDYVSFKHARYAVAIKKTEGWTILKNPSASDGLFDFGNRYPYEDNDKFWTGNHDGVRIFVRKKEEEPTSGAGFSFSGVVDSVQIVGDYPVDFLLEKYVFKQGDTFAGTYLFDPTITASSHPTMANYINPYTFASLLFSNGWSGLGDEVRLGPYGQDVIRVINDDSHGYDWRDLDSYYARTTLVDGPNILSPDLHHISYQQNGPPRTMGLYLADSTGQALDSTNLPVDLPPLNSFDTNSFIMSFGGNEAPNLWVHGHLESLEEIVIDP